VNETNEVALSVAAERRRRRRKASFEEKVEWARRFAESQLTQEEFCEQHALGVTTLQRWRAQVKASAANNTVVAPKFLEVKVAAQSSLPGWAAELYRANGNVLRLAHDISPALVEQLLRAC
jgi:transposase-like protein